MNRNELKCIINIEIIFSSTAEPRRKDDSDMDFHRIFHALPVGFAFNFEDRQVLWV